MPIGDRSYVSIIAGDLANNRNRIKKVLDYGIGMGFYGAVVRQWVDEGYCIDHEWKNETVIHGVEKWWNYRNPCWELYDSVFKLLPDYVDYDRIFFLDVIEHMAKEEGLDLLNVLKGRLRNGGVLWVGTPDFFNPQGAVYGNPYEKHLCLWTREELEDQGFVMKDPESGVLGYYANAITK